MIDITKYKKIIIGVVIFLIVLLGLSLKFGSLSKIEIFKKSNNIEYSEITHNKLASDLAKDYWMAKDLYDGKIMEISGPLATVDKEASFFTMVSTDIEASNINMFFKIPEDRIDDILKYDIGEEITVIGKIKVFYFNEDLSYSIEIQNIE